jgi:hypothetical protein
VAGRRLCWERRRQCCHRRCRSTGLIVHVVGNSKRPRRIPCVPLILCDAGRCAEVVEARSVAAFASTPASEMRARWESRSDWRCGAFLAKAVLRFQHSKLPAVCGKAALHSPKSGQAGFVRASGGLGAVFVTTQPGVRDGNSPTQAKTGLEGATPPSIR